MSYQTEIQQCINDFQSTLDYAKTCSTLDELYTHANESITDHGIYHYLAMLYCENDLNVDIEIYIELESVTYMFFSKIYTVSTITYLWLNSPNIIIQLHWREIAIDLCQQRIDYLKKFLHHG